MRGYQLSDSSCFPEEDVSNHIIFDSAYSKSGECNGIYGAILRQSNQDLARYDPSLEHHQQSPIYLDAYQWFMTEGDTHLFSFDSISNILGIDADSVRAGLRNGIRPSGRKRPNLTKSPKTRGLIGDIIPSMELRRMKQEKYIDQLDLD